MLWVRIIIAVAIFGHGIGHIVGFTGTWTKLDIFDDLPFNDAPWILPGDVSIQSSVGKIFGILWLISTLAFFAAAIGLAIEESWWVTVAIIASITSIVAVVPWWNAFNPGIMSKQSAVIVDIIILAALLGPWKDELLTRIS